MGATESNVWKNYGKSTTWKGFSNNFLLFIEPTFPLPPQHINISMQGDQLFSILLLQGSKLSAAECSRAQNALRCLSHVGVHPRRTCGWNAPECHVAPQPAPVHNLSGLWHTGVLHTVLITILDRHCAGAALLRQSIAVANVKSGASVPASWAVDWCKQQHLGLINPAPDSCTSCALVERRWCLIDAGTRWRWARGVLWA